MQTFYHGFFHFPQPNSWEIRSRISEHKEPMDRRSGSPRLLKKQGKLNHTGQKFHPLKGKSHPNQIHNNMKHKKNIHGKQGRKTTENIIN